MLIFSAVTPHPPILIPTISRDNLDKIKKTVKAMQFLADKLSELNPEIIVIISPHGNLLEQSFTINIAPEYFINFKEFGDLETELNFTGEIGLAHQIKEAIETKLSMQMINEENLDHGVSVPLYYIQQAWKNVKNKPRIISIGYCNLDNQKHFELGKEIAEIIHNSDKKIAVIASGDLSHCLEKKKDSKICKNFDKELIEYLKEKRISEILNLNAKDIEEASECGFRSILILLGILAEYNYSTDILSYENPLGVGYLVCNFNLK